MNWNLKWNDTTQGLREGLGVRKPLLLPSDVAGCDQIGAGEAEASQEHSDDI